jgi:hypothetical protein
MAMKSTAAVIALTWPLIATPTSAFEQEHDVIRQTSPPEVANESLPHFISMRVNRFTVSDGRFVGDYVRMLAVRSSTFREMVATLEQHGRISVTIAPVRGIPSGFDNLMGLTTFRPQPTGWTAFMSVVVDRLSPSTTIRALGHELAHVVEVDCLGSDTVDEVRAELDKRAHRWRLQTTGNKFETPYPTVVAAAIVAEWTTRGRQEPSRLAELSERYELPGCIGEAPLRQAH